MGTTGFRTARCCVAKGGRAAVVPWRCSRGARRRRCGRDRLVAASAVSAGRSRRRRCMRRLRRDPSAVCDQQSRWRLLAPASAGQATWCVGRRAAMPRKARSEGSERPGQCRLMCLSKQPSTAVLPSGNKRTCRHLSLHHVTRTQRSHREPCTGHNPQQFSVVSAGATLYTK